MELLAPAGSFESLVAAVQSGADAVYIGGSEFSARRSANNFSIEEIKKAADYCHLRNVKLHVAANILIKEKEMAEFLKYAGLLNKIGVDAVIIQDIGMASVIRKAYPDLHLHASTQMTVSSAESAKFLEKMGFTRIVLARELSKAAIEGIIKQTNVEIEVFAHGAICMCYSGQCLMSSIIGGRSGNRGMCAQPCRLPYEMGKKKGYLLSPKDMSLIDNLSELREIGVTSLKIEGRLKRSEYVAVVTGMYRKYLDNGKKISPEDKKELTDAFNRSGLTGAYFTGNTGKTMMSYNNPANLSDNNFSDEVKKRCNMAANFKKTEIFMSAELKRDSVLTVQAWDNDGHFASASGEKTAETAINKPLSAERLTEQLLKLGQTPFFCLEPSVQADDGITIPVSEVNNVRRAATEELERQKCEALSHRAFEYEMPAMKNRTDALSITAQVASKEQAEACIKAGITRIYADTPLANKLSIKYKNVQIVAKLPPIYRDDREYEEPKTDSVMISSIGQAEKYKDKKLYGDFRLNIFNSASAAFFNNLEMLTVSPELNLHEMSKIASGNEVIAYGRLPLMLMENCPMKALGKCQSNNIENSLIDRKKESFPLKCNEGCVSEILNSKPIFMADKLEDLKKLKISSIRLSFTVENFAECDKIVNMYKMALLGKSADRLPENSFTRGHFYRGVE